VDVRPKAMADEIDQVRVTRHRRRRVRLVGERLPPSLEVDAIESTPMPCLPAICMPLGEIDDAVTIGMSSWIGSS